MAKTEKKDKKSDKVKVPSAKVQKPPANLGKVPITSTEILAQAAVSVIARQIECYINISLREKKKPP
jgi:hypothetical protein